MKGSYLTDGKGGLWKVDRFDEQFVYLSQPGTIAIPISYKTVGTLTKATIPKSSEW